LIKATEALVGEYADQMQGLGVSLSFLFLAISNHAFSYEPVLHWNDAWLPMHKRIPEPEHLAKLQEPAANLQARALVAEIRSRIVALFAEFGAASNQLGKTYPFLQSLQPEGRRLLSTFKAELDPHGLMNPGALGDFE
jgi:FAD/FMN-containing dehydrogenase